MVYHNDTPYNISSGYIGSKVLKCKRHIIHTYTDLPSTCQNSYGIYIITSYVVSCSITSHTRQSKKKRLLAPYTLYVLMMQSENAYLVPT